MDLESVVHEAPRWTRVFPRHPAVWIAFAGLVVFAATRSAHSPAVVVAEVDPNDAAVMDAPRDYSVMAERYSWLSRRETAAYQPLKDRIKPPEGYHRIRLPQKSFGDYLRYLPCKPADAPLLDGRKAIHTKAGDPSFAAAVELQPSNPKFLRSANMLIRLRAEYLWSHEQAAGAIFSLTSGHEYPFARFAAGERVVIAGRDVSWKKGAPAGNDRGIYTAWLETLFRYSSQISLKQDTHAIRDTPVMPGDVFVNHGRHGHAAIVVDVVENDSGKRLMLIGQGGELAVTFHVPASSGNPWISADLNEPLALPAHPQLKWSDRRRFAEPVMPAATPDPAVEADAGGV